MDWGNLKAEMNEILEKYENGLYDQSLQSSLDQLTADTQASIRELTKHQAAAQEAMVNLQAALEQIDDQQVKQAMSELQQTTQATNEKLNDVRDKVLKFSGNAGKTIAGTLMKTLTGGIV